MLDNNEIGNGEGEGEQYLNGIRLYHVFVIEMAQQIARATSLYTGNGSAEPQALKFIFKIEASREPGEDGYDTEKESLIGQLRNSQAGVGNMRNTPDAFITELFYTLVANNKNRSMRVDSEIFSAEYDPPFMPIFYPNEDKEGVEE